MQQQQQQQNSKEGYYVSPNFSRTITTHAGNICDFAGSANIGLWDSKTMTNLSFVPNAVTLGTFICLIAIPGGNGNRVVAYSADRFSVIDFDLPFGQRVLWEKTETLDDIYQIATSSTVDNELYVIMISGELKIWDITNKSLLQSIKLIRKMYSKIQVFPGSKYFLVEQSNGSEFNIVERSTGLQQKIQLKSASLQYLILSEKLFAVIFNNFLVVYDISQGVGSIAAVLKCGDDQSEVIEVAALLNNQKWFAAVGEKGILYLWDVNTLKQLNSINLNKVSNQQPAIQHVNALLYLEKDHKIAIVDQEKRHFRMFSLAEFNAPQMEFADSFKLDKVCDASLKNFEICLKATEQYAVAIASYGMFDSEEIVFMNEVHVIDIQKRMVVACKTLHLSKFSLNTNSIHVDSKAGFMYYTMRNEDTDEGVLLKLDVLKLVSSTANNENTDSALSAVPFSVPQKGKHVIYLPSQSEIPRIIVPFNVKYSSHIPIGFAGFEESCGISVYDYNVKKLWQLQFKEKADFTVKQATMLDENTLVFVNANKAIEVWDITNNTLLSQNNLEYAITQIFGFENRLLVIDDKTVAHFYDADSFDQICEIQLRQNENKNNYRKEEIKIVVSTGDDDGNYFALYKDDKLARINTQDEKVTDIKSLLHGASNISLYENKGSTEKQNAFIIKDGFILFKEVKNL